MKSIRFILSWALITFLLLVSVVITDLINTMIKGAGLTAQPVTEFYPVKDMLFGLLSESLRALLLCYLFPKQKNAGVSYYEAIVFGLVISGLIATMWLVVGYGSFVLRNPEAWVVYDGIILLLQGILGGIGLQFLFRKKYL